MLKQKSTPQGWPNGHMLRAIRPGQTFLARVEELLGRKVGEKETIGTLSAELHAKAPGELILLVNGVRSDEH